MAAATCWALLLLTVLPLRAVAGRHLPAAGPPASAIQVQRAPLGFVQAPAAPRHLGRGAGVPGGMLGDGTQFQDRSPPPPRKMSPQASSKRPAKLQVPAGMNARVSKKRTGGDSIYGRQRLLVGSSPPTCQGKCGACYPCNPIHVSIGSPHGALTQQEYYPEVWRCKCGSRYFMP